MKDITVAILTISDRAHKGEYEDLSGPAIRERMESEGAKVVSYEILPDEEYRIEEKLAALSDSGEAEVIFTTGGTGFAARDVTPEATLAVIEKPAPGISEAIRSAGMVKTPKAMLSRGISGIRGKTLIINLPGSPKAVAESLDAIMAALAHGIDILQGRAEG